MGRQTPEARIDALWEGMHPRFKERHSDAWLKRALAEFMDNLVSEGGAEHDPETGRYRIAGDGFPTAEFWAFVKAKLEAEER